MVMYLNEDADPWIRTVRAVNVVVNGYEKSGGRNNESPYSEATADHIKIKQAFASQGYGKSQKLLNYTDLVAEYFDGFQGGEMYSRFNRSVHHNVVRQIELALAQDRDGVRMQLKPLKLLFGLQLRSVRRHLAFKSLDTAAVSMSTRSML